MFSGLNFFFVTSWNNTVGGLNGIVGGLQGIAYALLAITFLMGFYEAFVAGPSFRQLGMVVLKYAIASGIIASWPTFISDVVAAGTHIGSIIAGGTGQDTFAQLATQFSQILSDQINGTGGGWGDILKVLSTGTVETVEIALFVLAWVWYWVAMMILATCFCLMGRCSVLRRSVTRCACSEWTYRKLHAHLCQESGRVGNVASHLCDFRRTDGEPELRDR